MFKPIAKAAISLSMLAPRVGRASRRRRRPSSSRASRSVSISASRPAAPTTSTAAWWRATSASTSPATRPSCRRTWKAPARSGSPISCMRRRRRTAPRSRTMGRGGAFGPLFGMKGAQFDAERFLWLGSANDEVSLCASWHLSGVKSFDDVRQRELIIAATGPGDESQTVPKLLNARAWLQVQGDRRLSRLERDDDLDRARRDAGTLRLLLGQHEERAPPVARREEDQHPGAALLPEASRACRTFRSPATSPRPRKRSR